MPVASVKLYRVYVAAEAGEAPTVDDYRPHLHPLAWGCLAGSQRPWWATLQQDLSVDGLNTRLQNQSILESSNRQVEIWEVDDEGNRLNRVFWGELYRATMEIVGGRQSRETWLLHAAIKPDWHFGNLMRGQRQYNPYTGLPQLVAIDLEFNPEVDGKTIPNMLTSIDGGETPLPDPIWFDPDNTHTVTAREFIAGEGGTNETWTLREIVQTLCAIPNFAETFIKNPDPDALDDMFYVDPPPVHNLILKRNQRIPAMLDQLLVPHGFHWFVKYEPPAEPEEPPVAGVLRITIFERGSGLAQTIKLQAPGEAYDEDDPQSDVLQFSLDIDLGTLRNKTIVEGALIEREVTLPLYRGWPESEDGQESHEDNTVRSGRLFVANEAGDYIDLRPEILNPPSLPGCIPTRRIIEEMLRFRTAEGEREPPRIEYSTDDGETWQHLKPGGWTYLQNQIGFYVTAESEDSAIPDECLQTSYQWRITGVVQFDSRLEAEDDQTANSPVSHTVEQVIESEDRFFDRGWQDTGTHASAFLDGAGTHDIRDDDDEAEEYAEILSQFDRQAGLDSHILLSGHNFDYEISDLITKLEGRELSLNCGTVYQPAYPQVVGITWLNAPGRQQTQLIVDAYSQGGAQQSSSVAPSRPVERKGY